MNRRILVGLCVIWCSAFGLIWAVHHFWWKPRQEKAQEQEQIAQRQQTLERTSSHSRYQYSVRFAYDGFSGYAPLRTDLFHDEAAKFGVNVIFSDDGANYQERLKALADGTVDMAVFTVDALIKTTANYKDFPATIVSIVDESKGADAMVAAGKAFPNLDALSDPDVKIVCVPDSPSETLARVVMAHFNLVRLNPNPFEFQDSEEAVYKAYQQTKPTDKKVFVVWEPYTSRIIENPDYRVLIDSSKFRGYVLDVIVVRRDFLLKNENLVEGIVKSYFSTIFAKRNELSEMVTEDSRSLGNPLKEKQVEKLCEAIWWKNTQENFAHFGITSANGIQHLDDICRNTTQVLQKTGAISADPTDGKPNLLYYDGIMRKLFDTSWHPGFAIESVREEKSLLALNDEEWESLHPVGSLQVPRLVFSRGSNKLTTAAETTLAELAEQLKAFPQYYLIVRGNASSDGDLEANLKLSSARAKAAVEWLINNGVDRNRIRAESAKPNGSTTVSFILGELPY